MRASVLRNCSNELNSASAPGAELQPRVLLVSSDAALQSELQQTLNTLGFTVEWIQEAGEVLPPTASMHVPGVLLLDVRLPEVASGRFLAALHDSGVHRKCAIALIAETVSDEWIARLREGIIDDIVPRSSDAAMWSTHLSTIQRGHALYCELEQLREAVCLNVQHDHVTGLFNRETMLTILFRETDRVQRLRGALSLMLFELDDMDHWSAVHGPEVVNQMLREAARRIGRTLRSYDLLGRVGREQFLIVLPGCSTINAVMLAERLRMDVFSEPFGLTDSPHKEVQIYLTASFGITPSRGRNPIVVLREAELTLTQGKQNGPNSIRCHSESPLAAESESGDARSLFPHADWMAG